MKKKFVKVMFFGAMSLAVSTAVTSCKDYDDDINNLQNQVDANKASIADLQKFVNEGKWVKGVESVTGGFKITFSDGQSYTVVNGKDGINGTNGTDGKNGTLIKIGEDGYWYIDGVKSEYKAQGEAGKDGNNGAAGADGKDGFSPYIGEDGFWYFYNAETQKVEKSKYQANIVGNSSTYIVEDATLPKYTLYTVTKEGKVVTVDLPSADNIQSIALSGTGNTNFNSLANATINYRTIANTDGIEFNGKKYGVGGVLSTGTAKIRALINPSDIDASKYTFYLKNSKAVSDLFVLSKPEANMSEGPLTRAEATKNDGVYDFTISLNESLTKEQLVNINNNVVYALATQNAWGHTIISSYDLKVTVQEQTGAVSLSDVTLTTMSVGKSCNLKKATEEAGVDFSNIVAYYFETTERNISVNGDNATATVAVPSTTIKMHYLAVDGNEGAINLNVSFLNDAEAIDVIAPINWTIPAESSTDENVATVSLAKLQAKLADGTNDYSIVFADGTTMPAATLPAGTYKLAKAAVQGTADDGIKLEVVTDSKGNYQLQATFDAAKVVPTTYTVHLGLKDQRSINTSANGIVQTFDATINISDMGYKFQPTNYFVQPGVAKVYGVLANGKVTFNMADLYKNLPERNVEFKEVEDKTWKGDATWISGRTATVTANDKNVGKARKIKVTYKPYANANLAAVSEEFTMTILSEIHEGKHPDYSDAGVFLSSTVREVSIDPAKLGWIDYADKAVVLVATTDADGNAVARDSRLAADPTLKVSNEELITATWNNGKIVVALKANAQVSANPNVFVTVSVKDNWGITTTQKVMVPIK